MPAYPDPITVFVVDDHTLFRRGLMALIGQDAGLQVIGDASDASEALRQVPQLQPQVILLDNHLPGVLGVDAIAGLRQASPIFRPRRFISSPLLLYTQKEYTRSLFTFPIFSFVVLL